jgi:hypothetical protein
LGFLWWSSGPAGSESLPLDPLLALNLPLGLEPPLELVLEDDVDEPGDADEEPELKPEPAPLSAPFAGVGIEAAGACDLGARSAGSVGCRPPLRRRGATLGFVFGLVFAFAFAVGFEDGRVAGEEERGPAATGWAAGVVAAVGGETWRGEEATMGAAVRGVSVASAAEGAVEPVAATFAEAAAAACFFAGTA